jgi:phosphohistidine phosphatase
MLVILLRHGPAGRRDPSRWPNDESRPLTTRGEERTHAAARGLAKVIPAGAHVLTSPLERSRQTAAILEDALSPQAVEVLDLLAPGASYRGVIGHLQNLDSGSTVVLVGHEPDLGRLAGVLLFGAPSPLPLRKAGGCAVEFVGEVAPGGGRLLWFATPKMLRRLAGRKSRV